MLWYAPSSIKQIARCSRRGCNCSRQCHVSLRIHSNRRRLRHDVSRSSDASRRSSVRVQSDRTIRRHRSQVHVPISGLRDTLCSAGTRKLAVVFTFDTNSRRYQQSDCFRHVCTERFCCPRSLTNLPKTAQSCPRFPQNFLSNYILLAR